jgi:hypothetical protein
MMGGDADEGPPLNDHLRIIRPVRLWSHRRGCQRERRGSQDKKLDHRGAIMIRPAVRLDG